MRAVASSSAITASCLSELWRRSTVARWKPNTSTARISGRRRGAASTVPCFSTNDSSMVRSSARNSSALAYGFCGATAWRAASPPLSSRSVAARRAYTPVRARR